MKPFLSEMLFLIAGALPRAQDPFAPL